MRRFTQDRSPFHARLACIRHAASVQSEPESNSPVKIIREIRIPLGLIAEKYAKLKYTNVINQGPALSDKAFLLCLLKTNLSQLAI